MFSVSDPSANWKTVDMVLFTSDNFPHARPGYIGPRADAVAVGEQSGFNHQPPSNEASASHGSNHYSSWSSMSGSGQQRSGITTAPRPAPRPGGFEQGTQQHDVR